MNTMITNIYSTSYRTAHRFIPPAEFESNVLPLDYWKESMPNTPDLKLWNYDTTASIYHNFKYNGTDPLERPTKTHFDRMNYMMPQFEKYWSNPAKPINIPTTEYNDKYIQPILMSNIQQIQMPYVQPKHAVARKDIVLMQAPRISETSTIRKLDPYVTTQKLDYIDINQAIAKQMNYKRPKQKQIMAEYEPFYNEPIFNRKNTIHISPKTMKHVPHNALKTEMSASYKTPINTLSKLDNTVEMPISIAKNPTLFQIWSVPRMYTSEYSKIGGHK